MTTFRITPRARKSLKDIGQYTLRKWGKSQRSKYLHAIDNRFQWLADNPNLGIHRKDVEGEYYSYQQGEHLIFYMIFPEYIAIIGIPHQTMDIRHYFEIEN